MQLWGPLRPEGSEKVTLYKLSGIHFYIVVFQSKMHENMNVNIISPR